MPALPTVPVAAIDESDLRVVRTVDSLTDDQLREPSLLPGWSRAHVVAHLALNAEGLERVLTAVRLGKDRTMYDSDQARDDEIRELAQGPASELRKRLMAGVHCFTKAGHAMGEDDADRRVERTPGGTTFRLGQVPLMRWREVEIHHVDLDAGYTPASWPAAFSLTLIESMTRRDWPEPFQVLARDLARTWQFGEGSGGPVVTGPAGALGWWLTGREPDPSLSSNGPLPVVPPW